MAAATEKAAPRDGIHMYRHGAGDAYKATGALYEFQ